MLGSLALALALAAGIGAWRSRDDADAKAEVKSSSGTAMADMPGMHMGGSHPASVTHGAPGPGVAAPPFDLRTLNGNGRVRLADYAGRPVVLTFWASWCISCRHEFPALRDLTQRSSGSDLAVVGITYRDIPADARAFAQEMRANFTLALGGDEDPVARAYGIRAIPQIYFIDRHGVIHARRFGAPSASQLRADVAAISRR